MNNTRVVGQSVPRPDAYDKVTGGKGYPVNVALRGMLHAKLLRSPYPHARVRNIDTSKAETYPGVKSVLTAKDVPQRPFSPVYFSPLQAQSMVQDLVIMTDTVRYAGQPVAAVAVSSVEIAEQALNLIDVDYEELPAVFDPTDAMQAGAPQLHPGASDNIAKTERFEFGDIDAGFAEADHIFEATFQTQRAHTCYMEPRVCVVDTDQRGNVVVHSSMQHIFGLREKLAYTLDIPESKVRVVKPDYIGGGFGGKLDIGYIEPVAALLSMKARKPVRIEQTRYEDFITTTRNPIRVALKTGVKKGRDFHRPLCKKYSRLRGARHPRGGRHHGARYRRDPVHLSLRQSDLGRPCGLYQQHHRRRLSRLRRTAGGFRRRNSNRRDLRSTQSRSHRVSAQELPSTGRTTSIRSRGKPQHLPVRAVPAGRR